MLFWGIVAVATFAGYRLCGDSSIRESTYTRPLATMPGNVRDLVISMIDAAANEARNAGSRLEDSEIQSLRLDLYKMMAEGAVEQRNWEMQMTREQISYIGRFLSWFMKQKGLSYAQIEQKYAQQFGQDELGKFQEIINSASRSNPSVFSKLVAKLTGTAQAH